MSANSKIQIFVTGATGYIGGTVLVRLLEHPRVGDFHITALVRSHEKAEKLRSVGVNPAVGSLDDSELLEKLASESDIILTMADSDNVPATKAILKGLKKRYGRGGTQPIVIHTSGTGVLTDDAAGMYAGSTIWNDADPHQMATQSHRDVDLMLLDADQEGYTRTYIILPSTIYGIAKGRLVDLGVSNPHSIQIPALIRAALDRKQGGMIGEGKNLWPNVNIEDLGDLYMIIFDAALNKPETGHGLNGYYFGENGEHSLYDVGKAISQVLVDLNIGQSYEPTTFSDEEVKKYFVQISPFGSNSRCRANHSRSLGWKPAKTTQDMLASIRPEIEALLRR